MILSIDVGIKHLALCLYDDTDKAIESWFLLSLDQQKDIVKSLISELDNVGFDYDKIQRIMIEKQPGKNLKVKSIENYLHMYFTLKSLPSTKVVLYSPRKKLQGTNIQYKGRTGVMYRERKKASINLCKAWLECNVDKNDKWLDYFNKAQKKDDLADALSQVLAFCDHRPSNVDINEAEISANVRSRKPTEKQLKSGNLSRSNLKYLLTVEWKKDIKNKEDGIMCIRKHPKAMRAVCKLYKGSEEDCVNHLLCNLDFQ